MDTRVSVGLDNAGDGMLCGRNVARSALSRMESDAVTFALLFASHQHPTQVLKGVRDELGEHIPLIGMTSAGEYSHEGYVEDGAGLMLIQNDAIHFHTLGHTKRWLRLGALFGKLRGNTEDGLRSEYHHRTLMLFPDDASMNLDWLVDKAIQETAMLYNIIGGPGPTIPAPPRAPFIFHNGRTLKAGFAGAEILSRQPLGTALANGWHAIDGPYRITKIADQRIIKIDGRPAYEIYEDFALTQGVDITAGLPADYGMRHPIGICKDDHCRVSLVMGFANNGALQVTTPPPVNSLVHILGMQPPAMIAAARRVIRQARQGLEGHGASGALFIDCMSTAMLLADTYKQQQTAIRDELGDVPFLGFRSHGVIARLRGQISGHYECSVGVCIMPA